MTRYRYDRDLERIYEVPERGSNYFEEPRGPSVISDTLGPDVNGLRHMVTGEMIDSKSRFRQVTKDHGCVEVGNERVKPRQRIPLDRAKRIEDIKRAAYYVEQGRQHELGNDHPFGGSD